MGKQSLAKRVALTVSAALVISLGVAAGTAWAYYTDTTKAAGKIQDKYNPNPPKTEVNETPDGANKVISVTNTGDVDAMVRVKVFDPQIDGVELTFEAAPGWTQAVSDNDEGWWYYTEPVAPKASTPALKALVTVDTEKVAHGFDVAVVQQCTSARAFEAGQPLLGTFADGEKYLTAQDGE